jgi:hypothetical protein
LVTPDRDGDYPRGPNERRPHVDQLFNVFISKAQGRRAGEWVRRLAKGKGTPPLVFQTWRSENRYAPDGTVVETVARERLEFAKRLRALVAEEGVA